MTMMASVMLVMHTILPIVIQCVDDNQMIMQVCYDENLFGIAIVVSV